VSDVEFTIRLILVEGDPPEVRIRCQSGFDVIVANALRPHRVMLIKMLLALKRIRDQEEREKPGRNIVL